MTIAPVTELRLITTWDGELSWLVIIKCPHCRRAHTHGGGSSPKADLGPRVPHCRDGLKLADYVLTTTPTTRITSDPDVAFADARAHRVAARA